MLNFYSMFPWVLSERSKYNVSDVVFVCVHLACLIILLTTLSSLELCNCLPAGEMIKLSISREPDMTHFL